MSRRRKTPHKGPIHPKKQDTDEWVESMKQQLARTAQSQHEESRARMRRVMRRGGWSARGVDQVMERIPPDPDAPQTDEEVLFLALPWIARLSEAQRARCLAELSGTVGEQTPDAAQIDAMNRVLTHWRQVAEG